MLEDAGSGTCIGIVDCFDLCAADDNDCYVGCWEAAAPAGQAALWGFDNCLAVECPDDTDTTCGELALEGQCKEFVIDCQLN